MLLVDFETRSRCDLKAAGAYRYARDPSTEIVCCAFADSDDPEGDVFVWRNPLVYTRGCQLPPAWVTALVQDADYFAAHNAQFDRLIWEHVGTDTAPSLFIPGVDLADWYCTAAMCRVNALPGALDDATRALDAKHRKNHAGGALIRKLCIPRADGTFCEDPDDLDAMAAYCADDVRATRELMQRCRPLTLPELHDWHVNERINDRGVCIDLELATLATRYATDEAAEIAACLRRVTNGRITKHTQTARVRDFVLEHVQETPDALDVMTRYKAGTKKYSIDKAARAELLDRAAEFNLPDHVVEVIELTDDGNRSSVAKFRKMIDRTEQDGRARGALVYAGAGQTLRFASRGIQLHNMRRDCAKQHDADALVDRMAAGEPLTDVMNTLSGLLRPTIVPQTDHDVLVVGDWSAIEAMGLPWLADSPGAEQMLDVFRRGEDPYVYTADGIGVDDRQIGKVSLLSMGYGGAVGAFNAMGRNYGVRLPEAQVSTIVKRWRKANAWAPDFWYDLHRAAVRAVRNPGVETQAGRVRYLFAPELLDGTLLCILPGDVVLQYPRVRVTYTRHGNVELSALKASWKPKADATEWPRVTLWHGLLAENSTQALCAGILREKLRALDPGPYPVTSHCHDEIVLECPEAEGYGAAEYLRSEMSRIPPHLTGLPLKVEPTVCYRYGHKA